MDYTNVDNVTQWMTNETTLIVSNDSAVTIRNETIHSVTLDQFYEIVRQFYVTKFYGSHFVTIFIVTCIVCIFGYVTNFLNIVVLLKMRLSNSINLFLISLAISDIIQITTQASHVIHYYAGFKLYPHYGWVVFFIANTFIENSFVYISNWLVAATGIWRCIAVTRPLRARELCSLFRTKMTIGSIVFLSFLFSSPILFLYTYELVQYDGHDFYDKIFSEIAEVHNGAVFKVFLGLQQLKGLIPMILMVAATVWLVVNLYRIRQQRIKVLAKESSPSVNHRITLMLTVLLVLYLLSNIPDSFMFLISISSLNDEVLQEEYKRHTDIIRIFSMANNSVSFFVYYVLGEDFRIVFNQIFLQRLITWKKERFSGGVSEHTTVRSKSFDVGQLRKASADSHNAYLRELKEVIDVKEGTL